MRQMEPREIKPAAADQTVRGLLAMPLAQILPLSAGTLHQDPGCPECYTLIAAVQGNATVSSYPRSILLEAGQVMALSPGYAWDLQAVSECLCIIVRLEGDAAVQNDVCAKVGDHIQTEDIVIKLPALFHVLDGNQSGCVFHSCLPN